MDVNIENVEVQDVEDAPEGTAGTGDLPVRDDVLHAVDAPTPEDGATDRPSEGEGDAVVLDDQDGSIEQGSDVGGEVAGDAVTELPYDYTDVYANDGISVDCDTQTTTYWFEQKVVGFKENEDGTVTMVDLGYKAERHEDHWPSTPEELASRGCEVPVTEIGEPLVIESTEASAPVQPEQPAMLAETGVTGVGVPLTLGAIALVVVGAWLIANQIAKKIGRKNK